MLSLSRDKNFYDSDEICEGVVRKSEKNGIRKKEIEVCKKKEKVHGGERKKSYLCDNDKIRVGGKLRHLMCEREQGEMETCIRFFLRQ
jgi:hypothetical protein